MPSPQSPTPAAFDDAPAKVGEWGWRPAEGAVVDGLRPFCWRPQQGAVRYRVQVATDAGFEQLVHDRDDLTLPVWCRPALPTGADYVTGAIGREFSVYTY